MTCSGFSQIAEEGRKAFIKRLAVLFGWAGGDVPVQVDERLEALPGGAMEAVFSAELDPVTAAMDPEFSGTGQELAARGLFLKLFGMFPGTDFSFLKKAKSWEEAWIMCLARIDGAERLERDDPDLPGTRYFLVFTIRLDPRLPEDRRLSMSMRRGIDSPLLADGENEELLPFGKWAGKALAQLDSVS